MEVNRRLIIKWLAAMATWPGKALAKTKVACYTGSDVSGPFFRPDAPFRHDLTFDPTSFRGAKTVIVSGTIFGDDCQTPLVGATVEIWQADPKGKYDMESDLFRGRARILTDSEGKYCYSDKANGDHLMTFDIYLRANS